MSATRARALWDEHGPALVAEWIDANPGSRPPPWWAHDAPELRKQLGGRGVLADARFCNLIIPPQLGIPAFDSTDVTDAPRFESQAAFLDRHGLLTNTERKRLPRGAFEPEAVE